MNRGNQPHQRQSNTSLGIFKMDNSKKGRPFFDDLVDSANTKNTDQMNCAIKERLNIERRRAMETLEKSKQSGSAKQTSRMQDKENSNNLCVPNSKPSNPNCTDYVSFRKPQAFNISDLVTDETIHLESMTPERLSNAITFEPSEITGRSTQYNNKQSKVLPDKRKTMSVSEILATSFAPKARDLCETLRSGDDSIYSESFTDYNRSQSLPHTADLSMLRDSATSLNGGCSHFDFDIGNSRDARESVFSNSEFVPGELMTSRLLSDEISWAQKFAAIPTKALSEQAKAKLHQSTKGNSLDLSSISNSTLLSDPNFSVGSFFNKRSDNIQNIMKTMSPEKCRSVECDKASAEKEVTINGGIAENLTHKLFSPNTTMQPSDQDQGKENSPENSYLESISALGRAMHELEISAKEAKPSANERKSVTNDINAKKDLLNVPEEVYIRKSADMLRNMLSENKENIDPQGRITGASNTLSFTESLLNAGDLKLLQTNSTQARSPLSPLSLNGAVGGSEDNVQVVSATLPPTTQRRTSDQNQGKKVQMQDRVLKSAAPPSKTLSSTHLEVKKNEASDSGIRISPDLSKNRTVNGSSSNTMLNVPTVTSREGSPTSFEGISPITSPSVTSSTTHGQHQSPNTRKSIDHQLVGGSSPASSVASSGTVASSISRCSSNSEFCLNDGKSLPVKVTNTELSWVCTKMRTDSRKSLQIKNTANKRLVLRLKISGPGFQLVNCERGNILTLHSQECRTITINFCPTVRGVAIGSLSFYSPVRHASVQAPSLLDIPLYGYGGHIRVHLRGILKGPVGAPFLPLGQLCDLRQAPLERHFTIYNRGLLNAFALINVDSVGLLIPRLGEAFDVDPQKAIIPPGGTVLVRLVFHPKRDDFRKIAKRITDVFTVANLRVVYGDEAGRQRMLRLMRKMDEPQRLRLSSNIFHSLWTSFPGESDMSELNDINESTDVAMDLFTNMQIHEITLTVDHHDADETMLETSSALLSEADETVLFRTICIPNAQPEQQQQQTHQTAAANVVKQPNQNLEEKWSVVPKKLAINLHNRERVSIGIYSSFKSSKHFEVTSSFKTCVLQFAPTEGYIPPGNNHTEVNITFNAMSRLQLPLPEEIFIIVTIENGCMKVPLRISN